MTQKEFIKATAADVNAKYAKEGKKSLSESNVDDVIKSAVKVTHESLAKGEKIQISGLGSFEAIDRPAREGRNPLTGETIQIAAKKLPKFKAAKMFKDILN